MKYKNFELDQFQIDAIDAINANDSVIVSAATGTGKTLIADYVIDLALKTDKKVIYTSPIKALSNQKFREFKDEYGDKVGLLTGDIVINPEAPILIMTTEIYRNMLLEKKEPFPDLSYVVFDEIHYINDIERGTVWEESLIFSPKHVRFCCLSATIPNYQDFADWIANIQGHTVRTVNYMKRAVPLQHELFDFKLGICDIPKLKTDVRNEPPDYYRMRGGRRGGKKGFDKKSKFQIPDYTQLLKELESEGQLPAIYFTFSRKDAFEKAHECSKKFMFTTSEERKEIIETCRELIPKSIANMKSVQMIRQMLTKGVGVHHAGILPKMKEVVEKLFAKGIIKVLFATETFAVGINMPAKTVVMNAMKKYDGKSVRYLSTKEYFQMAGRAGRRGIDTFGRVIVIVNRNELELDKLEKTTLVDKEPIRSQFNIGYNTVLNLVKNHTAKERDVILRSNFGYFMKKQGRQQRIDQSYVNYLRVLKKMEFVSEENGDYNITWKGNFASHIFAHEIELAELYYSGVFHQLNEIELLVYLTSLEYEPRLSDKFYGPKGNPASLFEKIESHPYIGRKLKKRTVKTVYMMVSMWAKGCEFTELLEICNLAEGDIIRLFRRILDTLKQIKSAVHGTDKNEEALHKIERASVMIDRDVVAIEF